MTVFNHRCRSLLTVLCLLACAGGARASVPRFQAVYDGETVRSVPLHAVSSDQYVSLRDIAAIYGADLVWRPVSGVVALRREGQRMDVYLKSTRIRIGAKKARLSLPAKLVRNDAWIPLDFLLTPAFAGFAEAVSSWNDEARILTVEPRVTVLPPRFYTRAGRTQVVIEMTDDLSCSVGRPRDGKIAAAVRRGRARAETLQVGDGVVEQVRVGTAGRQADITVSLGPRAGAVEHQVLDTPRRLLITVHDSSAPATSTDTAMVVADASAPVVAAAALPVVPGGKAVQTTIVLDAGHGGEDPGAIGPNGTKEKDINLAIVYELKRLFEEDGGYRVVLTRTDDTFIPLVERTSMANDAKADLFVSVHCNANESRTVSGFEIYFLNENASDSDAAATAVLENSVVKFEGKPNRARARLQELLWSMAVNEFINESSALCAHIAGEAAKHTRVANRGVKQAGFFVLKGAQMPAVLVESAFLSNYAEEAKLRTRTFQSGIADAIYEGVKRYGDRRARAARSEGWEPS